MMASGGSHLQRPFGRMLAHHFAHVAGRRAHARGADIGVHGMRGFGNPVVRIASHQSMSSPTCLTPIALTSGTRRASSRLA